MTSCSYSYLSLPSIRPSFSLSLRGVSSEQKVPDDKQNMVLCCCHRPAVYTPGLESLAHTGGESVVRRKGGGETEEIK